jgi:hypothetical protein
MEDFEKFKAYIKQRIENSHQDGWGRDVVSIDMNLSLSDAKALFNILDNS